MNRIEIVGTDPAEMIRAALEQEQLNQRELADKMGTVRQYVSQMLNRSRAGIRFDSFRKMAEALGYEIVIRKK